MWNYIIEADDKTNTYKSGKINIRQIKILYKNSVFFPHNKIRIKFWKLTLIII